MENIEDEAEMLNLNVGENVYVYANKCIFPTSDLEIIGNIKKDMFGVVIDIKRWENTDLVYDYNCYKVTIKFNNGKIIKIKDKFTQILFRRYEFIKAEKLNEMLPKSKDKTINSKSQTA